MVRVRIGNAPNSRHTQIEAAPSGADRKIVSSDSFASRRMLRWVSEARSERFAVRARFASALPR